MEKKSILLLLALLTILCISFTQANTGSVKVTLTDLQTKDALPFASVTLYKDTTQVQVGITDLNGVCYFKQVPAGKYNVKATYIGYQVKMVKQVGVYAGKTAYLNIKLTPGGIDLKTVTVTEYSITIIDPETTSGGTIDVQHFQSMPNKNISSVLSTQPGVVMSGNGNGQQIQVRGSRPGYTTVFVDGERAIGTTNVSENNTTEQQEALLGGVPAQYADAKSGIVSNNNTTTSVFNYAAKKQDKANKVVQEKTAEETYVNEEYSMYKESTYNPAANQPLSTFAIDVDGASYSNARRLLEQGMLPQKDAVRVEEFINYFPYNYPQPKDDTPFSITTEYAACPWDKNHNLLQIGLKGKEVDFENAPPSHLVFLIDVSGSMEDENKLPLLKRAFKLLVKQLRPKDRLS